MKPARTRSREAGTDIDWEQCIFCQDDRPTSKTNPLRQATEGGIKSVIESTQERDKYHDEIYVEVRFKAVQLSDHALAQSLLQQLYPQAQHRTSEVAS